MVSINLYNQILDLLKNYNVIGFTLSLLIANSMKEIADSIINGILIPSINPILDRITKNNNTINIGKIKLELDTFIKALLKFISLLFIIILLMNIGIKMSVPVQSVRIIK
tara:strand:+ start:647 stop:976 length:330 start_codon:yes stop_codon:yes gene_type:complete